MGNSNIPPIPRFHENVEKDKEEREKKASMIEVLKEISFPRFKHLSHIPFFLPLETNLEEKEEARFLCVSKETEVRVKSLNSNTDMNIYLKNSLFLQQENDKVFPERHVLLEVMEEIFYDDISQIVQSYMEETLALSDCTLKLEEFNDFIVCIKEVEKMESWKILQTATTNFYNILYNMAFSGVTCFVHPSFAFIRNKDRFVIIFFASNECISAIIRKENTPSTEEMTESKILLQFIRSCECSESYSVASTHFGLEVCEQHDSSSRSRPCSCSRTMHERKRAGGKRSNSHFDNTIQKCNQFHRIPRKGHENLTLMNLIEHNVLLEPWAKIFIQS